MAALFNPFFQAIDGDGAPIASAKLYFYTTGTSTPQDTFAQADLDPASVNTNPVVADASGRFGPIYLGTTDYKAILKDADGVTLGTLDPLLVPTISVITTEGDLILGDTDGNPDRLPIGAADRVLYSSGTTASWEQINLATSGVLTGILPKSKGGVGSTLAAPVRALLTAYSSDTGKIIPYDDTIPTSSEGLQIFSQAFTVGTTGNRIRITVNGSFDVGADAGCLALFVDAATAAAACHYFTTTADNPFSQTAIWELTPSAGAHTYKVRAGSSVGVLAINGTTSARKGGGVNQTSLIIEELPTT